MKSYPASKIRNVAVLGHSGSGKTTVMEAALNTAGVTTRIGRVEDGNTISDYDAEEIRRKVSIGASIIPIEWKDEKINFIDTPGFFDFVGEVKQAVRAADVALIIVSAKSGVEVGVENAWEIATEAGIPKIFFLNDMDDENADFDRVVEELKDKFGTSVAPIQAPFKENGKFVGFVNAIKKEGRKFVGGKTEDCPIPEGLEDEVETIHKMVEEAVAATDDDLTEKFLMEEPLTTDEITNGLKNGVKSGLVAPVLCGSALLNIGIRVLMNSILEYVPSAVDIVEGYPAKNTKTDEDILVKPDVAGPFAAFVFKTIADPFVGRLSIFRVISGVLTRDTQLYNTKKDFTERVGHMFVLRGKEQIEVNELMAGDIGAIAKLTNTATNDTLCVKEFPVIFPDIAYPQSFYAMGIAPKGKGDEDKISQALSKMREEDKTLYTEINKETKQQVVYGAGDSHLDVLLKKLSQKYKIEAEYVPAVVPYRETIRGKSDVQGKHKKQSGGHGQYGDVRMRFEPAADPLCEYEFEQIVFGGSVPRQYFPAVEKGVQENCKAGPLAGYPVVGVKAILYDGSYHDVDSSEMAFKLATTIAFKDGFIKAKPCLLEPIASAVITVPDQYTGDIMGDMNKRRGRILGMEKHGSKQNINAEAPLAEMFKYALDLRSMTQGRGSFTMKFERYEEAPNEVQQKVIEARKKEDSSK